MWPDILRLCGTVIVAVITVLGSKWVAERAGRTNDRATAVDEKRLAYEERDKQITLLERTVKSHADRIDSLESRDRAMQDYVAELRQHIAEQKPPPPPPWPVTLLPRYREH